MDPNLLRAVLKDSTKRAIGGDAKVAVAYSGGLDSSVIAALAAEFAEVRCYTCAVDGSFDATHTKQYAELERVMLSTILVAPEAVETWVRRVSDVLGTSDPVRVAYTIPIISVLSTCEEKLVLTGSGADELFGGYAKYASVRDPKSMMCSDLDKLMSESLLLKRAAESVGKRIEFPFTSEDVVAMASKIPLEEKIGAGARKIVLREMARQMNLPSFGRPKKAAQYSSGIMREMERQARHCNLGLSAWTASLSANRPELNPHSKVLKN